MEEEWRDIEGFEGYQVSNLGRVKSLGHSREGRGRNQYMKPHLLSLHNVKKHGVIRVQAALYKGGKKKYPIVSRLVYEAFVGKIPEGMQVNHLDEDPSNNKVENLNLMTPYENTNYGTCIARRAETFKKNGKRSKPVIQCDLNGNEIAVFPSAKEAARQTNISQSNISVCCNKGILDKKKNKFVNVRQSHGYIWKYKNG